MSARAFAPAKINLYLHVGPLRSDGFHPINSLMVFADVGDEVSIASGSEPPLRLTGPFASGLGDADNLVVRAARHLAAHLGRRGPLPALVLAHRGARSEPLLAVLCILDLDVALTGLLLPALIAGGILTSLLLQTSVALVKPAATLLLLAPRLVGADLGSGVLLEEDVVGDHDGSSTARLQAPVDVLKKGELLVARREREVVAGGEAAALLGSEGGIGEDQAAGGRPWPSPLSVSPYQMPHCSGRDSSPCSIRFISASRCVSCTCSMP